MVYGRMMQWSMIGWCSGLRYDDAVVYDRMMQWSMVEWCSGL